VILTWIGAFGGMLGGCAALSGVGWAIYRDIRKDRKEQNQAATDAAVREALLEARVAKLEDELDDDD
jgi:hypothetical protein